jgi:dTDP-4-amino-4,6-dideoxygalactose transaminase
LTKDLKQERDFMNELAKEYRLPEPVYITRPRMPELEDYHKCLEKIWDSRWLTNGGQFHEEFERRLKEYLGVEHLNLFVNGTIALLVALQALRINSGEVITTPFTFPATSHVLYWNGIRPVFCDIEDKTCNLDPSRIEGLIRPDTKAILAVHVYGNPCDVEAIQAIADRHGLYVIYDAAHAFGVQIDGKSVMNFGDISAMSFHATKLFNSIEGGALVSGTAKKRNRIQYLKNFGISDEETVVGPGINGKMNEFQASFGLLQLDTVDQEIQSRELLTRVYRQKIDDLPGITLIHDMPGVKHNYGYLPILVDPDRYGVDRNRLSAILKECNVVARKYFYPLCSQYPCYASLPSARPEDLPVARRVAEQVLCLPLYGELEPDTVEVICRIITEVHMNSIT